MAAVRTLGLLVIGLILFFASSVHCQISGVVLDASSSEPVSGAVVTVLRLDSPVVRQISSLRGKFKFNAAFGSVTLKVKAIGYADTELSVTAPDSVTIKLSILASHEQLIITGLRHEVSSTDVPVSTVVARQDQILSHNPQGLDVALRYVPGVTISEDQVSIRGSSGYSRSVGARVLLLLDGMPFLAADNGDMKFDAIPLLSVDRVEVIKGGGSTLYGSSALGGVINVITKAPMSEQHSAFNLYSGFYDQPTYEKWRVPGLDRRFVSFEAGTTGSAGDLSYLVSGAYRRNEGYRLGDDNFRWNGFAKAEIPLNSTNRLTVSGLIANDDHGGWVYWRGLNAPFMPNDSLGAVNGRIHSSKLNLYANLQSFLSDVLTTSVKFANFRTEFSTDPKELGDTTTTHSTANSPAADLSGVWALDPLTVITAGISFSRPTVRSNLFQDHAGITGGAFTQLEYGPVAGLRFTPGLRWDLIKYDSSASENRASPRIGVVYNVSNDLSLRANYAVGFRAPSIAERFIQSRLAGFDVSPNFHLKPEKSTSAELGATWSAGILNVSVSAFAADYEDLIEPGFVNEAGKSPYIQFRNVTQARISGYEENVQLRPWDSDVLFSVNYTYLYPEDRTSHQVLQFRSRHSLLLSADGAYGGIKLGMDYRFQSRYETMDSLLSIQIPDGGERVDIHILDVRAGYDLARFGLPIGLTFQVQNALNYYYVEVAGNLAPIRNYSLRLEANF